MCYYLYNLDTYDGTDYNIKCFHRRVKNGKVRFYKIYRTTKTGKLQSPYRESIPVFHKGGVIKSNRTSNKITPYENRQGEIHKGIHVFVNRKIAEREADKDLGEKVFVVYVDPKDFVAGDTISEEAVFTKVRLDPRVVRKFANKRV